MSPSEDVGTFNLVTDDLQSSLYNLDIDLFADTPQQHQQQQHLSIEYNDNIYLELGDAGRVLLKQIIRRQPLFRNVCRSNRQLNHATLQRLLQWAYKVGAWDDAVRIHNECKGLIPLSEDHRMLKSLQRLRHHERRDDCCGYSHNGETIPYYPGIVLSLGASGRQAVKKLITKRLQNNAELKKRLTKQGILTDGVRKSTVEELIKLAWFTGIWDNVIQIHNQHMKSSKRRKSVCLHKLYAINEPNPS